MIAEFNHARKPLAAAHAGLCELWYIASRLEFDLQRANRVAGLTLAGAQPAIDRGIGISRIVHTDLDLHVGDATDELFVLECRSCAADESLPPERRPVAATGRVRADVVDADLEIVPARIDSEVPDAIGRKDGGPQIRFELQPPCLRA